MYRSLVRSGAVATAAAVTLGLVATASQADPTDYTPPFQPDCDDVVGVGSDTTMFAINDLADGMDTDGDGTEDLPGYNAGADGVDGTGDDPAERLASWDAFDPDTGIPGGDIWVRDCPVDGVQDPGETMDRPNGSSDGISRLHGAENEPLVSFARSSRSITTPEANAGLSQFPFAEDTLVMVGNAAGPYDHPVSGLTIDEVVAIYECDPGADQWSEVVPGGTSATINPLLPQAGSGTRAFFVGWLEDNGLVQRGDCVDDTVQEHDPQPIIDDENSIAPFSLGRYNRLPAGDQDQLEEFPEPSTTRTLYNVVRTADLVEPWVADIFGPNGFICSDAGDDIVEQHFVTIGDDCGDLAPPES